MIEVKTLSDIKRQNPDFSLDVAFDVGAHVGMVSQAFLNYSPSVIVHAFEPVPETYGRLSDGLGLEKRAILNQIALSKSSGTSLFTTGRNTGNRFASEFLPSARHSRVEVITGDQYCDRARIKKIDYLKIDAEGFDLDVLIGFKNTLSQGGVDYIQIECTPNPNNRYHVSLERVSKFLEFFDYYLFGLGEVKFHDNARSSKTSSIWFCNAIFARHFEWQ